MQGYALCVGLFWEGDAEFVSGQANYEEDRVIGISWDTWDERGVGC